MAKEYRYTSADELLRAGVQSQGRTVLHRLAEDAKFHQVPPALLTRELLLHADALGCTPLHVAATHGSLRQLKRVLTSEMLVWTKERSQCFTPLQLAAMTGHLDQIAPELLTPAMIMSSSEIDPRTVAEILVEQHLDHLRKVLPSFKPEVRAIFAAVLTDSPDPKGNAEQSRRTARRA
jgi:hypothetical protein